MALEATVEQKKEGKKIEMISSASESTTLGDLIESRRTDELVLAFCGPLGSGVSNVINVLKDIVEGYFSVAAS